MEPESSFFGLGCSTGSMLQSCSTCSAIILVLTGGHQEEFNLQKHSDTACAHQTNAALHSFLLVLLIVQLDRKICKT